jgi:hypothetical protein
MDQTLDIARNNEALVERLTEAEAYASEVLETLGNLFRKTEAIHLCDATAKETTIIFNNLGDSFAAEFENINTKDEVDE